MYYVILITNYPTPGDIQPHYEVSTDIAQGPNLVYIKFMGEEATHSH